LVDVVTKLREVENAVAHEVVIIALSPRAVVRSHDFFELPGHRVLNGPIPVRVVLAVSDGGRVFHEGEPLSQDRLVTEYLGGSPRNQTHESCHSE
jgi:hypothetical protein